jgi:hypothetical protein
MMLTSRGASATSLRSASGVALNSWMGRYELEPFYERSMTGESFRQSHTKH